jgi:hypothetical protein
MKNYTAMKLNEVGLHATAWKNLGNLILTEKVIPKSLHTGHHYFHEAK